MPPSTQGHRNRVWDSPSVSGPSSMLFHAALCQGLPCEATPIGFLPPVFSLGSVMGSPARDRGGKVCVRNPQLSLGRVPAGWLLPMTRATGPLPSSLYGVSLSDHGCLLLECGILTPAPGPSGNHGFQGTAPASWFSCPQLMPLTSLWQALLR